MDRIEWSDRLSVGVKQLDEQHIRIIRMINRMIDHVNSQIAVDDWDIISDTLFEMTQYSQDHFDCEEALMNRYGYPKGDHQEELHMEFLETTVELSRTLESPTKHSLEELLAYLGNWWVGHILGEDMQYKLFFADHGVT